MESDEEILELEQNNQEIIADEVIQDAIAKKPKVKLDKRKTSSRNNLAKARAAKLALLKQAREEKANTYNVYSESEDSDSEDSEQELVIQKKAPKGKIYKQKPKKMQVENKNDNSEIAELKSMMSMIFKAQMKAKSKPVKKQINVQLAPQPVYAQPKPKTPNPRMQSLEQTLIDL